MDLPSREECYRILREHQVPENIIRHSEVVNKIAVMLARRLKDKGIQVDVDIVDRASLLHDLDKIRTLKSDRHGFETQKMLTDIGYPQLGEIAKLHRYEFIKKDLSWEARIVNYADKRVKHEHIVSLRERFTDMKERYNVKDHSHEAEDRFFRLEEEIFTKIDIDPERIQDYLI
jgi:uncharacterized protein